MRTPNPKQQSSVPATGSRSSGAEESGDGLPTLGEVLAVGNLLDRYGLEQVCTTLLRTTTDTELMELQRQLLQLTVTLATEIEARYKSRETITT